MNVASLRCFCQVNFYDFALMITDTEDSLLEKLVKAQYELLTKLFDLMDIDNSGFIDIKEVIAFVGRLGYTLVADSKEANELLNIVDISRDGEIGFSEFVDLLAGEATPVQRFIRLHIVQTRDVFHLFCDPDEVEATERDIFKQVTSLSDSTFDQPGFRCGVPPKSF